MRFPLLDTANKRYYPVSMTVFLVLSFLFFAGSLIGWVLEVFWRKFFSKNNPEHRWLNPGFLHGPYLPLYGISLCALFLLSLIDVSYIRNELLQKCALFVLMAACITALEFIAGIIFIKGMRIKLWDYSGNRFNFMGIICLQYSFYWVVLSGLYYFLIHHEILEWLYWFTNHLAFCYVVGFFFGIFSVDVCYTFHISSRIRAYAAEKRVEVLYESLKAAIQRKNEDLREKRHFLFALKSSHGSIHESLREIFEKG